MAPAFDLLVAGELNPDLILGDDVTPEFGQVEKLVQRATLTVGSSAAICACAAARLGLKVAFVGRVGQDEFGNYLLRALQQRGIDTRGVIVDPGTPTGLSVILARGADRAILTYPGAIPTLRLSDIDPARLAQARHLHLTSYFIQDALRPDAPALFDLAHNLGLTTSLDTNYDPAEHWNGDLPRLLERTDVFLPNETECRAIGGRLAGRGSGAAGAELALDAAIEALCGMVGMLVVKRGADGALAAAMQPGQTGSLRHWRSLALPVDVVDTVGAGDTFNAGFLFGFLSGWDPQASLRLAAACGSLSTRRAGGIDGQPTLDEAQEASDHAGR